MKTPARKIEVTLTFTEADLNSILEAATFAGKAPKVKGLTDEQFAQLAKELQKSAREFVNEIVDGSKEAAANDWLCGFMGQFNG